MSTRGTPSGMMRRVILGLKISQIKRKKREYDKEEGRDRILVRSVSKGEVRRRKRETEGGKEEQDIRERRRVVERETSIAVSCPFLACFPLPFLLFSAYIFRSLFIYIFVQHQFLSSISLLSLSLFSSSCFSWSALYLALPHVFPSLIPLRCPPPLACHF